MVAAQPSAHLPANLPTQSLDLSGYTAVKVPPGNQRHRRSR